MNENGTLTDKQERIPLFDNVKALLIVCVIAGHFSAQETDYHFMRAVFIFIWTFHMPLFIFISGLFHRRYKAEDPFKRYRFLSFIFIWLALKILITFTKLFLNGKVSLTLLSDEGVQWFMFFLAACEVFVYIIRKISPAVILPISFLLMLVSGYDSSLGDYLTLSRLIVFMPFFLIGYYLDPEQIVKIVSRWYLKVISAIILVAFALICWFKTDFIYAYRGLFTGRNSFATVAKKLADAGAQSRLFTFVLTVIICFAILCVIPNIRVKLVSEMGKRTLQPYFWHRSILYILVHFNYFEILKNTFGLHAGELIYIGSAVLLTVILSAPIFRHPTDELMHLEKRPHL